MTLHVVVVLREPNFDEHIDGFFRRAEGLLFYEASAQPPVFELYGPPGDREVGVAHLGGYLDMHGPPVTRDEARRDLGIEAKGQVLLYAGTVRWTRSPVELIRTFLRISGEDDLLIVTGRGTEKLSGGRDPPRIRFRDGMIEHRSVAKAAAHRL